jgi:hypothetical protein
MGDMSEGRQQVPASAPSNDEVWLLGEGGRLFAWVCGIIASLQLVATVGLWVRAYPPGGGFDEVDVRPLLDNPPAALPTIAGSVVVIASVWFFVRSRSAVTRRSLALLIVVVRVASSVFHQSVFDHHLLWVVPDAVDAGLPRCDLWQTQPCIAARPEGPLTFEIRSGRFVALFGLLAALRHRSTATSRWSEVGVLVTTFVTIVALGAAFVAVMLWLVSQMGY